jgi:serine/threonine protein kinase
LTNMVNTIINNRYMLQKVIATGSVSLIFDYIDLYKENCLKRNPNIIKIYNKPSYRNEITILKKIRREIDDYGLCFTSCGAIRKHINKNICKTKNFLIMPKGTETLSERLKKGNLSEKEIHKIVLDIVKCVHQLHNYKGNKAILHRDIKPENIIKYKGRWVLIDFDIAVVSNKKEHKIKSYFGTKSYTSPEYLKDGIYGNFTDIYGIGLITLELFVGVERFKFINHLLRDGVEEIDFYEKNIPKGWKRIIHKCLDIDYQNRPDIEYIKLYLENNIKFTGTVKGENNNDFN